MKEPMPEWDEDVKDFMTYWFSGLVNGLEDVDDPARQVILRQCGKACAASYTAGVFLDARARSPDMEGFLADLVARFPGSTYELLNPTTIQVRYQRCACDLVRLGLVKSALICDCSVYNLQENFTRALASPVHVTLQSSILGGAPECTFLVSLESPSE
jgi:hypothetical protein